MSTTKSPPSMNLEQILFAGGDLVEISRSEAFPKASVFHSLALSLATETPIAKGPSYLFGQRGGFSFLAKASLLPRDPQGREGAFCVHIFLPLPQKDLDHYSPSQLMASLIQQNCFLPHSKEEVHLELHQLQGLPLNALQIGPISPRPIATPLPIHNLLSLSGQLLKDRGLLLCGADQERTLEALLEVMAQVEKERRALGNHQFPSFALSLHRADLAKEFPLDLIALPHISPSQAKKYFPQREIYVFKKNIFSLLNDQVKSDSPSPSSPLSKISALLLLSLCLMGLFYWLKIRTPSPKPVSPKIPHKSSHKTTPVPPRAPPPKNKSAPQVLILHRPSSKAFSQALKESSFFRWPRNFYLALLAVQFHKKNTLLFWMENDKIKSLPLLEGTKSEKFYQCKLLAWDDFSLALVQKGPRSEMVALEKKVKTIIVQALKEVKIFLQNPKDLSSLAQRASQWNFPLGIRSRWKRDHSLSGLHSLLISLAHLSVDQEAKKAFLWMAQEIFKQKFRKN